MENQSFFERVNNWAKGSIMLKIFSIGVLILILMAPSNWIKKLIDERESRRYSAIQEVSSKWGSEQIIGGPVLSVPYESYYRTEDDKLHRTIKYAHFLPDQLQVEGNIEPNTRKRGIYEVVLYKSKLELAGSFKNISFEHWSIPEDYILWDDAFVSIGIPDMRGINDQIVLDWNGENVEFEPGIRTKDIFTSGLNGELNNLSDSSGVINFSLKINLNGSQDLRFLPLGKVTEVNLSSNWGHPKFDGAFLPDTHNISSEGFKSKWKVLHLNRNYPQQWLDNNYNVNSSSFGVVLFQPVDGYQKTTRSAKYNIMFILLTFLIFFFVEIMNKKRIHPIQYLLVGFAITLFYVLLLSISEHLSFNLSYLISGTAILGLVAYYSKAIFKSFKLAILMAMFIAIQYSFFFTLLQLQDFALLLGSIGLFMILAFVMYLSRNIEWYAATTKNEDEEI